MRRRLSFVRRYFILAIPGPGLGFSRCPCRLLLSCSALFGNFFVRQPIH